jgi:hypothetical protein
MLEENYSEKELKKVEVTLWYNRKNSKNEVNGESIPKDILDDLEKYWTDDYEETYLGKEGRFHPERN